MTPDARETLQIIVRHLGGIIRHLGGIIEALTKLLAHTALEEK